MQMMGNVSNTFRCDEILANNLIWFYSSNECTIMIWQTGIKLFELVFNQWSLVANVCDIIHILKWILSLHK